MNSKRASIIEILEQGLYGQSSKACLVLYLISVVLLGPLGAVIDFKRGDDAACVVVIAGAVLLPVFCHVLVFAFRAFDRPVLIPERAERDKPVSPRTIRKPDSLGLNNAFKC